MKNRIFIAVIAVSLSFPACGGGGMNTVITPPPPPTHNVWTWMGGSNSANPSGTYGTLGTASPNNTPGGRASTANCVDASGAVWLFGGVDYQGNLYNDLWRYSAGEWTWMSGSNAISQSGVYGTLGVSDPNNVPGARYGATGWCDSSGTFWLFGGLGLDSTPLGAGLLGDLWKYNSGQWTWVGGSNLANQFIPAYGTEGVPSPNNFPLERASPLSWTDASGNFWLFAGNSQGVLNDLWEYSAGEWTWVSGSNTGNQVGVYGTLGVPSPGNVPGNRITPSGWIDASGGVWVFAGWGDDPTQPYPYVGTFNDLWRYSAGEWTWMGGSDISNQSGVYGTRGTSSPTNVPGARNSAVNWIDASGNFWLFGGEYEIYPAAQISYFNDLWNYHGSQWTWVGGSNTTGASGSYGVQGQVNSANIPGARSGGVSWTDTSGNLWLFGGFGYDSATKLGGLNDLWKYKP